MFPDAFSDHEQWGDFISLGLWGLTFIAICIATIVNAHKHHARWDGLSYAMIAKTGSLAFVYVLAAVAVFYPGVRPEWARWSLRLIGIIVNISVTWFILVDADPNARFVRWVRRHIPERRST